ncbi:MAG: PAS domain-containing protein [Halorientalis sp.]
MSPARLPYRRVVEDGEHLRNERYTVRTGDGRERSIIVYGAPLRDEDGAITGAIIPFEAAEN